MTQAELLKIKGCDDGENSLLERVSDATGRKLYRVRLDGFKGDMGVHAGPETNGQLVPSSEAFLSESHVDDYLIEMTCVMTPLIEVVGAHAAWNLVFSERNGNHQRDRLAAAKKVSALASGFSKIHGVLRELRYNWKHDAYDFHDIWVVKGKIIQPERDALQNVACLLHLEYGGVHMGHGDGYHRSTDERPFVTMKRISVPILKKAIAKEAARVIRENGEWQGRTSK